MRTYDTPGAYIERDDRAQGGISRLRTDVTAFVGIAERGPARRAVAIESRRQFEAIFGGVFAHGYLAYVVKAFFENGGRRCWVVRVESDAAEIAFMLVKVPLPGAQCVWRVEANSSGAWGNLVSLRLTELRRTARRARTASSDWAQVDSIAGFSRGSTVELIQEAGGVVRRELHVLSAVEATHRKLIWNHPDGHIRLESDAPLTSIIPVGPMRIETISYQLQVSLAGKPWRVYDDLALCPNHPRYGPAIVNGAAPLFAPDRWRLENMSEPGKGSTADLVTFGRRAKTGAVPEPVRIVELRDDLSEVVKLASVDRPILLAGGVDGLSALRADDFVGTPAGGDDSDVAVRSGQRGIAALDEIDEISLVAVPDIHIQPRVVELINLPRCVPDPCLPSPPTIPATPVVPTSDDAPPRFSDADVERVVSALISHCELHRDRVALIDPLFAASTRERLGIAAVRDFRKLFDSTYAALYFPWIEVLDSLPGVRAPVLAIPPCGHVAGQIAATDLRIGVHKAPANVPLRQAERTTFAIDETAHGVLNLDGINAIRARPGRGIRVAGARLVSSESDFRFLNVRRLLLMIERSIETAIQWAVFEGNNWLTRAKLMMAIHTFLQELWNRGALMGATQKEGFFVRCDETNNPADARARGELVVDVGVAPSVPFEFIVLRIGRSADGFELSELTSSGG